MENIIFRRSWFKTLSRWEPARVSQFIKLLEDYLKDKPIEITDGRILDLWDQVEPLLQSDRERYLSKCETNRENGKKGGRPKNPTEPTETQPNPTEPSGFYNEENDTENPQNRSLVEDQNPEKPNAYFGNPKNPKEKEKDKEKDNENENEIDNTISSNKEVLVENEKTIFNLVYHTFIKGGFSPEEAKTNTIDAIKLKSDEELKVLFNIQ
jgi:hypothetical protein